MAVSQNKGVLYYLIVIYYRLECWNSSLKSIWFHSYPLTKLPEGNIFSHVCLSFSLLLLTNAIG